MVNWHRAVYVGLTALGAVALAVVQHTVTVPPGLGTVAPYAGLAGIVVAAILPAFQDSKDPAVPHG